MYRVLIVEDDPKVAKINSDFLDVYKRQVLQGPDRVMGA